jgi:hypothetical protein
LEGIVASTTNNAKIAELIAGEFRLCKGAEPAKDILNQRDIHICERGGFIQKRLY